MNSGVGLTHCVIYDTQIKFNTPSTKQFSQQRTTASNDGGSNDGKSVTEARSETTVGTTPAASTATLIANGGSSEDDKQQVSSGDGETEIMHTGYLKEWTLMLHGTRDPPYGQLSVRDPHSKLAIVKKAHTIAGPETSAFPQQQSAY